jgi:beta-mannanase
MSFSEFARRLWPRAAERARRARVFDVSRYSVRTSVSLAALAFCAPALAQDGMPHTPLATATSPDEWTDKRPVVNEASLEFGVYDPHGDFEAEPHVSVEHLFLPWENVRLSALKEVDAYARQRGRRLMITVEPSSWGTGRELDKGQLVANIKANRYAENIANICRAAAGLQSSVTFRWGQEMEDPDSSFIWAGLDPSDFRMAYRQFVTQCREHAPDALFMWSPKGMPGLEAYFPGDDVVDAIGVSVFGLEAYDLARFGRPRRFAETLRPAYDRVVGFGKPIHVAELGYEGSLRYVSTWAKEVAMPSAAFPQLAGVVYFNDVEPNPWNEGFGQPNWRVSSDP